MRTYFFLPLALAAGCSPCEGRVRDPHGLAPSGAVESLGAALADWDSWTGGGRVCVDEVVVTPDAGTGELYTGPGGYRIELGPNAAQSARLLRDQLCYALDLEEGLSDELSDAEDHQDLFVAACGFGPPEVGWMDTREAACGSAELSETDALLLAEVYTDAPAHDHVALGSSWGFAVRAPDVAGDRVAPFGAGLLTLGEDASAVSRLDFVDPLTGATTPLLDGAPLGWVAGGPDGAVVIGMDGSFSSDTGYTYAAWRVDPDLSVTEWPFTVSFPVFRSAVVGRTLFLGAWMGTSASLAAVDLDSGVVTDVPLPAAAGSMLVEDLVAVPGGLVARLTDATIDRDADVITMRVERQFLARWDPATEAWAELPEGVVMRPIGALADGTLAGEVLPYPNTAFGTYDASTDTLALSESLCPENTSMPDVIVEDVGYDVQTSAEGIVVTPLYFDR